jgi:5-formyltetrahydrofolate cyclo-ligase
VPETEEKAELRKRLRAQRRALSAVARAEAAERLCRRVAAMRLFRVSRRIACYWACDGEIDATLIMERAWRLGKHVYLPVLSRVNHDRLWFARIAPGVPLRRNRFGIPEPQVPPGELLRAQALDLILVPLVGFDCAGNRLGMGGGFYDRSLGFLAQRHHWRKPHVVGLAYEFQRVTRLPTTAWDVPLAAVITDRACYEMRAPTASTIVQRPHADTFHR